MNHSLSSPGSDTPRAALLDRRLTACLLAAGGMLAGAQAHAGIVYSGVLDTEITIDPVTDLAVYGTFLVTPLFSPEFFTPTFTLGDGGFSVAWYYDYLIPNPDPNPDPITFGRLRAIAFGGAGLLYSGPIDGSGEFASIFLAGDPIDGTTATTAPDPFKADLSLLTEEGLEAVDWLGQDIFVGIGVPIDGKLHSGWFKVNVPLTIEVGSTATVLGWAYCDTPNTTIEAGQTEGACAASVPEPSVPSLLLLGLGAAGVAGWRRRRAAERAEFRTQAGMAEAA